jgi:hypothetical protein
MKFAALDRDPKEYDLPPTFTAYGLHFDSTTAIDLSRPGWMPLSFSALDIADKTLVVESRI